MLSFRLIEYSYNILLLIFAQKAKKPVEEIVTAVTLPEPIEPPKAKGMERTHHYFLFCLMCIYLLSESSPF